MKNRKTIYLILLLSIFGLVNCYCQTDSKNVMFEILAEKNQPMPGVNIRVKSSKPTIENQTDINGKAVLNLSNLNVEIELNSLCTLIKFKLMEKVDFVKVDLKKRRVIYYSKNKILKKGKLKGY